MTQVTSESITMDPLRGQEGQACFTPSCQKPESALYLNNTSKHWYCLACATKTQERANRMGTKLKLFANLEI